MSSIEQIITLTRQALDEFESVPLAASLRRAHRIARLRGDITFAYTFQLDLSPHGGSTAWRRTEAFELLTSVGQNGSYPENEAWRTQLAEEWLKERKPSKVNEMLKDVFTSEHIVGGSIENLIRNAAYLERATEHEEKIEARFRLEQRREMDLEMVERTTHRVFTYLCTVERELAYIGVNADIFERHRLRMEGFLSQIAPQVLEQFTAAYRRAREDDAESKTHALTTCRRIIEAVADVVFPPQKQPVTDSSGKPRNVGSAAYKNRLMMFLDSALSGNTHSKTVLAMLEDLGNRLDAVYEMTNKGVHSGVTQAEVDMCVMQTYLLTGEVIRIFEETSEVDAAEHEPVEAE